MVRGGLELFQVNDRTWLAVKSIGEKSFRIVKEISLYNDFIEYGIYYESLNPGTHSLRRGIGSFEEAITYLQIELEKEKNKIIGSKGKKHEEFTGGFEQSLI